MEREIREIRKILEGIWLASVVIMVAVLAIAGRIYAG